MYQLVLIDLVLLPPIPNAGDDQIITDVGDSSFEVVSLNGNASSDPDGAIIRYTWLNDGLQALVNAEIETSLSIGIYIFELVVTNNDGLTHSILLIQII